MTARQPLFFASILPAAKELQGQLIRPLAIIQQDQRRPLRRTQDVQERGQRLQAAYMPECFWSQGFGRLGLQGVR